MTTRRTMIAAALAAVMAVSAPAAALAQETTDERSAATNEERRSTAIDQAKRRALEAIDRRLETLGRLDEAVGSNAHISDAHARKLHEDYAAAIRGLEGLADEIEAAATLAEVFRLAGLIVTDYRVYLVIVPKTHEVVVSDTIVDVADRFSTIAADLEAAIARADDAGYDVSEARRWLLVALDEIAEARRTGGPVADQVVDLTASDWPDPAQATLRDGAAKLRNARLDLREAGGALHRSYQALRRAIGAGV